MRSERPPRSWQLHRHLGSAPVLPLAILFGLNTVDELDRAAFAVLLPEIKDAFHLDVQGALNVVAAVLLVALAGQIIVGYYADRFRRVPIAIAGAATWGTFCLLTGLAPTVLVLAIARAGSGLGKAVNDPVHNSLIADYYEPDARLSAFGIHKMANPVGAMVGPLAGGLLAYVFGWRAPFIVFAVPTLVLVLLAAVRLREPVRGAHERRLSGADEDLVAFEEERPGMGEAWRICMQVRSARRLFYSLPFLAGSAVGLSALYALLYDEVYGLNEAQRGLVAAVAEPFGLVGLAIGVPLANRLARRDPAMLLRVMAAAGTLVACWLVLLAAAPTLPVAILGNLLIAATLSVVGPGLTTVMSMIFPPRARSTGYGIAALWFLPGAFGLVIAGAIAEAVGIRAGLAAMAPFFLIGSFILASGGSFVVRDIERIRASAAARAEMRRARQQGRAKLLTVRALDVAYDHTQVLFGVDLDIADGEIVALLGTNGSGKSTLLKAVSGAVAPAAGAVVYDGRDITAWTADQAAAEGIVVVPGGRGVFPTLTVAENLDLAGWLIGSDAAHLLKAREEVLAVFPVLRARLRQRAGDLSGGEQQMLTLGQALIARPKLLMIDELSLGLAPVIVDQLLDIVRRIHSSGTTVVVVEQSVNVALSLAERAVFMEKGEVRFDGPATDLLHRHDILRSVFLAGATPRAAKSATPRPGDASSSGVARAEGAAALEARGVSVRFGGVHAVDGVDLEVPHGAIVGIIGPNGAGKTTLFDLLSGYAAPDEGRVLLEGRDVTAAPPDARARSGLGRSFQDARLFPSMTVANAIAVALERHITTRDPVAAALASPETKRAEREVATRVGELIELLRLEGFADKFVSELSTGSRRIVDLACGLAHAPIALLLDEPSAGIAQREAEALAPLLRDIRARTGAALVVIEHDMSLITAVADELVALDLGRVIARGRPDDVIRAPRVVAAYLGSTQAVIHRSGNGARRRRRSRPLVAARADVQPRETGDG